MLAFSNSRSHSSKHQMRRTILTCAVMLFALASSTAADFLDANNSPAICCWDCNGVCEPDPNNGVPYVCNADHWNSGCDFHHCAPWCGSTATGVCTNFTFPADCSPVDGSTITPGDGCCWASVHSRNTTAPCTHDFNPGECE